MKVDDSPDAVPFTGALVRQEILLGDLQVLNDVSHHVRRRVQSNAAQLIVLLTYVLHIIRHSPHEAADVHERFAGDYAVGH